MKSISFRITTKAPVIISRSMADRNMVRSAEYIPGTTVLGIFAARYMERAGLAGEAHLDGRFARWFLGGDLSFGCAYPVNKEAYLGECPKPVPLYVQKCKRGAIYNLMSADTDEKTKPFGGYFTENEEGEWDWAAAEKGLQFHHKRDRILGRSTDGNIFNYEYIEAGQEFAGEVTGAEDDLEEFLTLMGDAFEISIGASRNTQYGRAEITLKGRVKEEPFPLWETLQEGPYRGKKAVTLVAESPAVLINENGFPDVSAPNLLRCLADEMGVPVEALDIDRMFARCEEVDSYVAKWQSKKPLGRCLIPGSSFRVVFVDDIPDVGTKIKELLKAGIGERRNEGFGRLTCIETPEEPDRAIREPGEADPVKPSENPPAGVQEMFRKIVQEKYLDLARQKAYKRAARKGSKSLFANLERMLEEEKKHGWSGLDQRFAKIVDVIKAKKIARQNLEKAEMETGGHGYNMGEHISKYFSQHLLEEIDNEMTSKMNSKRKELLELCGLDTGSEEFRQKIYYEYLLNLFRRSRKNISAEGRNGKEGDSDGI
ncbi:RAMP superfamily CRISPR-associated protein [Thermincola ferriacetica]